ncbi:MAG: hypothetical protein HGA31_01135 [Candidatus Moranbacteria bacterium]|nr:hypothetical protein [Candidatus Moranbacteria bacterium]
MLNIFQKKKKKGDEKSFEEQLAAFPGAPKPEDMNMVEKLAMKRLLKMSPEDQKKAFEKAMTPKNIEKHKQEIIASLEEMRKNRMISDDQYRLMKRKYGIK